MAESKPLVRGARSAAIAFNFVGTIGGGAVAGWLLDDWFGSAPWGVMTGTLLGVVGGFVTLIHALRALDRIDHERQP